MSAHLGFRRARPALALVLAAALTPLGCREKSRPAPTASPSASVGPRPPPVPRPAASAVAPARAPVGCRVLSGKGDAPRAPKVGDLLEGQSFFDLPAGALLSLRHSETTREFSLHGPGRFRACPKGEELVAVTRGKVKTTSGPGARAGAEVRLATPFGVVHFGDAELELDVTEKQATVWVAQGTATVDGRKPADPGPTPRLVSGPKGRASFGGRTSAGDLVGECVLGATTLASSQPPAPAPSGTSLGQWAVGRLKARQAARHACTRALAAAGLEEGPTADLLWDRAAANIVATGTTVPPSQAPEK
jgi:hypothetical protein